MNGQELLQFVSKEYMSSTNRRLAVKEYCEVEGKQGDFIQYDTILHNTTLNCTVLHCTVLYCTALHCTALYCTALYTEKVSSCVSFTITCYHENMTLIILPYTLLCTFLLICATPHRQATQQISWYVCRRGLGWTEKTKSGKKLCNWNQ